MLQFFKQHRTAIVIVALVAVAFVVYSVFFVSDEAVEVTSQTAVEHVDSDLIALLAKLRGLTLDGELFASPVFQGLIDFSQTLRPEDVGRNNPFAPLGR